MEITITSQAKRDYLFIETKAVLETTEDLINQSQRVFEEISKQHLKRILIDEPETKFPKDLVPYFDLVKNYIEEFPPEISQLKIAIVIAKEYIEIVNSWETICVSRGLNYCAFTSIQEAKKWLLNQDQPM